MTSAPTATVSRIVLNLQKLSPPETVTFSFHSAFYYYSLFHSFPPLSVRLFSLRCHSNVAWSKTRCPFGTFFSSAASNAINTTCSSALSSCTCHCSCCPHSGNCCVRPPTTQWLAYWAGKLLIVRPDFVRSALLLRKQLIKSSCYYNESAHNFV